MTRPALLNGLLWCLSLLIALWGPAAAQNTQTYDVFTFTAPAGWKRESGTDGVLRLVRNQGSGYCVFDLYRNVPGNGRVDRDFEVEWETLVVKRFSPDDPPETEQGAVNNGWQNRLGGGSFPYQGGTSLAVLSTFSAGTRAASVLMVSNDPACLTEFERFLGRLSLKKPAATATAPTPAPKPAAPAGTPARSNFAFTTTTFDDGWVSVQQKDWVLARKGGLTVYLHYPSPSLPDSSDSTEFIRTAWNALIAPRYRDVQGYTQGFNSLSYIRPHLAAATATSLDSGRSGYVSLFEMGDSGWIEIVTPDRQTFVQTFGIDIDRVRDFGTDAWNGLWGLRGLNRFAVGAADLRGTWSSSAGGLTQWVNAFTGLSAGATGFSSNQTFEFRADGTYAWSLAMASGVVGAQTFQGAKSSGKLTMNGNWQINFSEIERKPRLYNAYFEAGRNGERVLWLQDTGYGGYSAFVRVK